MCVCVCVYIYICMYVCVYIFVCVYIYILLDNLGSNRKYYGVVRVGCFVILTSNQILESCNTLWFMPHSYVHVVGGDSVSRLLTWGLRLI